jgi:hypothetical protein
MKTNSRQVIRTNNLVAIVSFALVLLGNAANAVADLKADADTVFDWAELTFPTIFPSHQPTQRVSDWLYRRYPESDLYVGINNQDVYYISGNALREGGNPTYLNNVPSIMQLVAPVPEIDYSVPQALEGHLISREGEVFKVSTNACIPDPQVGVNYYPQQAMENGISVLSRINVTQAVNGISGPLSFVTCTKNIASNVATTAIALNVCYTDDSASPMSTQTQGTIVYEQVADCFETDADIVTDIANDYFWVKVGDKLVKLTN